VAATASIKRLFVRKIYYAARDSGRSFLSVAEEFALKKADGISSGKTLVGTSANGVSANFQAHEISGVSATDLAEIGELILSITEEVLANAPSLTTNEIKDAVLARIFSVKYLRSDFREYRQ